MIFPASNKVWGNNGGASLADLISNHVGRPQDALYWISKAGKVSCRHMSQSNAGIQAATAYLPMMSSTSCFCFAYATSQFVELHLDGRSAGSSRTSLFVPLKSVSTPSKRHSSIISREEFGTSESLKVRSCQAKNVRQASGGNVLVNAPQQTSL